MLLKVRMLSASTLASMHHKQSSQSDLPHLVKWGLVLDQHRSLPSTLQNIYLLHKL